MELNFILRFYVNFITSSLVLSQIRRKMWIWWCNERKSVWLWGGNDWYVSTHRMQIKFYDYVYTKCQEEFFKKFILFVWWKFYLRINQSAKLEFPNFCKQAIVGNITIHMYNIYSRISRNRQTRKSHVLYSCLPAQIMFIFIQC